MLGAKNVNGRSQNETVGFRAEVSHALRKDGDEFLDSIVTGNETWGFHHTPESKQEFPQNQKIQNFNFSEKIMASIFWDRKGILLVDFMPPGATINAAAYCDTLTRLR